ncbi:sensor histidine kinase [Micromonospora aurantiaca]|uniref:sensor histidine kinase n=1 Tax=Micromonospora aurantiaca (nom. illeg.) TaxID=47850 RepID=UPI000828A498|nr:sensor histidine kinase [Micromonospora aurantiaca]SCL30862.1 Signal transduction histidine kinase [Micromonospora aurantiaca]
MSTAPTTAWRRPAPTAAQLRADLWVGLAVTVLALFELTLARSTGAFLLGPPPSLAEQVWWTVAVTAPLAVRRRWPAAVAVVVSIAFIAGQARAVPLAQLPSGALFAALFTLGAWGADRRLAGRLRAGVIVAMFGWLALSLALRADQISAASFADAAGPVPPVLAAVVNGVFYNVLFFGFAYYSGQTAWVAARRRHELREQAEQLRRSQVEARERAVMGERVRIARELHDVVAHHVSVMGVQAAACRRVFDRDRDKARTALAAIEETARTSVDELRRMLGVLRYPDAAAGATTPEDTAGIDQVAALVDRARDTGLRAELGVYGEPAPLPRSVSQAAYRIVQEAVTNVVKHAHATTLDVRIRYLARELEIDVSDDGHGGVPEAGAGLGLIGMRERVAAHGGEVEAGPRPGGGFRVRARMPLPVEAAGRAA